MKTLFYLFVSFLCIITSEIVSADNTLKILSTTSTRDSGFYDYILPIFEKKYNIKAYSINTGTGQAINNAKNCNGDILITHAEKLEESFVNSGYGVSRNNLMYNNYVIVGPSSLKKYFLNFTKVTEAYNLIYSKEFLFISRGDESGTHYSEQNIWRTANIEINNEESWYLSVGQGMGPTLNMAIAMDAITYTDIATWLKFSNKANHAILFQGDGMMENQYGITLISSKYCQNINHKNAKLFHDWILSEEGQKIIGQYQYNNTPLFNPNFTRKTTKY